MSKDNSNYLNHLQGVLRSSSNVILPNSHMKIGVDLVILVLLIMNLIYIPIELCFSQSVSLDSSLLLYLLLKPISLLSFFIEIVTHLNTAIYVNGLIIQDRKEILHNYAKSILWWDLFTIVPIIFGIYFDIGVLKLLIILRFFDILQLIQDVEERFQLKDRFRGQCQLVKLMFFILCLAHLIACAWYKLAAMQHESGVAITWVEGDQKDQNSSTNSPTMHYSSEFDLQYVRSFYWTIVTMTTLGYGDITPTTQIEQIFAISVGLLSTVVFAFSVSSIGEILKEISKKQGEFQAKMSSIELYMKKRNLDQQLRLKVRKYFAYLDKEEQQDTNEGAAHLHKLAASLREEVFVDMYGRLLKSKKIFDLHFSTPFLNQLALKMKEASIPPESIIYEESQPGNRLYFVINGEVEMLLKMRGEREIYRRLCTIKEGQIFGELEFFSGQMRENTARSVNVTSLVYVEFSDFVETLKGFPQDYEQMAQKRDNINLYSKTKGLDHKCFSCSSFDHCLSNCPLVNYIPNKCKILKRFNACQDQPRNTGYTERNDFRTVKTLRQLAHLKSSAMRFHFVLYNEQLMQQQEQLSQSSFECESGNESFDQSPSLITTHPHLHSVQPNQNSPQGNHHNRIDRKRVIEDELRQQQPNCGFLLNTSFIADETPKYQKNSLPSLNPINSRFFKQMLSRKFSSATPPQPATTLDLKSSTLYPLVHEYTHQERIPSPNCDQILTGASFLDSDITNLQQTYPSEDNHSESLLKQQHSITSTSSKSIVSRMAKIKPNILSLKCIQVSQSQQPLHSRSPIKEEEEELSNYYPYGNNRFPSRKTNNFNGSTNCEELNSPSNSPPLKNITSLDDFKSFSPPSKQARKPHSPSYTPSPIPHNHPQQESHQQQQQQLYFSEQSLTTPIKRRIQNNNNKTQNKNNIYSLTPPSQILNNNITENILIADANINTYPVIKILQDNSIVEPKHNPINRPMSQLKDKYSNYIDNDLFLKIHSQTLFPGSPTPTATAATTVAGTTAINSGVLQQTFAIHNSSFSCSTSSNNGLLLNRLAFSPTDPTSTLDCGDRGDLRSLLRTEGNLAPPPLSSSAFSTEPIKILTPSSTHQNQLDLPPQHDLRRIVLNTKSNYNRQSYPNRFTFSSQQHLNEPSTPKAASDIPTFCAFNSSQHSSQQQQRSSKLIKVRQMQSSQLCENNNSTLVSPLPLPFSTTGSKFSCSKSISTSNLKLSTPQHLTITNSNNFNHSNNQFPPQQCQSQYESPLNHANAAQEGISMSMLFASGGSLRDSVEDFDQLKVFVKYFVKNNADIVISAFNRRRKTSAIVMKIHQQNIRKKKKNLFTASKFNIQRIALAEQKASLEHQHLHQSSHALALKSRRKSLFYTSPKPNADDEQSNLQTSDKNIPISNFL